MDFGVFKLVEHIISQNEHYQLQSVILVPDRNEVS